MVEEEALRDAAARIAACAGDSAALATIDSELANRPEPEARRLRIKIASLRLTLRKGDTRLNGQKIQSRPPAPSTASQRYISGHWAGILAWAGLKRPDGRPLHRYRIDDSVHEALGKEMQRRARFGLAEANAETAALFVLWAAHWFQREYRGGLRRWDDLSAALGVDFDGDVARQLTRQGLSAWGRPPQKSEAAQNQWLMTLAVEGGFPAGVLDQDAAWAARYLTRVVASLLSADPLDEEVAFAAAQMQADHAQRTYRQEVFFALAANLGMVIVQLRREVELDARARGVPASAWLDSTRPGWREELPIRAGSEAAARLVDGLLLAEAFQLGTGGKVGCERTLRRRDGLWHSALQLNLDGIAHGGICQALADRRERLRAYPTGAFARYAAGELAIFEPPAEAGDGWRIRPSRRDTLINAVPFTAPIAVELRIDGRPVATAAWPGGDPVRGQLAIFCPGDGTDEVLTLIGEGSGQYKPEPLIVAVPRTWTVTPHGGSSTRDALPEPTDDGRRLWCVTGAVILRSPEGDTYRVASGQAGTRRDRLRLSGSEPKGLMSGEPEVELFAGSLSIQVCEGQNARQARSGEIRWRPDGERGWRPGPVGTGRIDIAWRDPETGFIRDRRRVMLLPQGAQLACRREGTAAIYTPGGFAANSLASPDANLLLERRGSDVVARFTGRPSRRAEFDLTIGTSKPFRVVAPFPLEAGIARWSGVCVQGGPRPAVAARLSLAELSDCVAFGRGVCTLHAVLLDRDRRPLRGGTARWTFDDELPMRGVADDLAALLLPFADIDVVADLTFDDGAEHWQVSQFEAALVLRGGRLECVSGWPGEGALPLMGRAINDLTVEVTLGTSTFADRVHRQPPPLPESISGTWLLYLRDGDAVVARPSITCFGPSHSTEAEGLAAAVTITHSERRETQLLNRLAEIALGTAGTQADVRWLAALVGSLNGLPPASLDVLRLLARCPGAAARLALHAGEAERSAVLALADTLPFAWFMVSHAEWASAAAAEEADLCAKLEGVVPDARPLARAAVLNTAEKLVRAEPLLGWPLYVAGLASPPKAQGPGLLEAARDHIRRHGDRVSESGPRTSLFRGAGFSELPREFLDAFHPVHLETLDAPCAAAATAAARPRPSDDAVRRIKTTARADPLYFAAAFEAHFMRLARSPHF